MEERSPLPAGRLVYGSGNALCGRTEIDEDHQGECLSSSPSTVSSQLGSPCSLSPGSPPVLHSLVLFKWPSCSPCFAKKKWKKNSEKMIVLDFTNPCRFFIYLLEHAIYFIQSYILWYVVCVYILHVAYYWWNVFVLIVKVYFLCNLWACLWAHCRVRRRGEEMIW